MSFKYKKGILGGTFDHFHLGHQVLINQAFEQAEKITIGIATAKLIQKKPLASAIEDYQIRKNSVKNYLFNQNWQLRSSIIPLDDIYGISLTDSKIEAIFVTSETSANAKLINEKRKAKGFQPLAIVAIPFVNDENGQPITSERIRKGEIDRSGKVFVDLFQQTLTMPEDLKEILRKPAGMVVKNLLEIQDFKSAPLVIGIGDITSILFCKANLRQEINIVDFKSRREPISQVQRAELKLSKTATVSNKPGTINKTAVKVLRLALKKYFENKEKQTIVIDGEEDLLALPAIVLSPLGSIIVYGIYGLGSVVVKVTEEKKKEIGAILSRFKS